jgi:hypothetical protein
LLTAFFSLGPIFSSKRIINFVFSKEKAGRLRKIKIFGQIVLVYRKKIGKIYSAGKMYII